MKIAVGISGGVDSSTAALMLSDEGHEVFGLTAWLWRCGDPLPGSRACCGSVEALKTAREAATSLGLEHEVVDLSSEFERDVVADTALEFASGRTPNPCVVCNERVRFPLLVKAAKKLGAQKFATGHYARVEVDEAGRAHLYRGADLLHDQTYFLFAVDNKYLAQSIFPLSDIDKNQTRATSREASHPAADRPSSQDLCFTGGRHPSTLATSRHPEAVKAGAILTPTGERIGTHRGLVHYTVGQRKGLGVAWTEPLYVIELRPESNELVVGAASAQDKLLGCSKFTVKNLHWQWGNIASEFTCLVQLRYRSRPTMGTVKLTSDGNATVTLSSPVRAVAPGQCAVFYSELEVIGGGWIDARLDNYHT